MSSPAGIIHIKLSDRFPNFFSLWLHNQSGDHSWFVEIRTNSKEAYELQNSNIMANINVNPYGDYNIIHDIIIINIVFNKNYVCMALLTIADIKQNKHIVYRFDPLLMYTWQEKALSCPQWQCLLLFQLNVLLPKYHLSVKFIVSWTVIRMLKYDTDITFTPVAKFRRKGIAFWLDSPIERIQPHFKIFSCECKFTWKNIL